MTSQPRRVALFGATGKIGHQVLDQLLGDGHDVTAFVRNPAKLDLTHPELRVIQGELSDAAAVASAIRGADAVISALGPALIGRTM
jgi:putative NADH-flavin reductase